LLNDLTRPSLARRPELQAVELEMAPILANHESRIYTFPGLFERLDALHEQRHQQPDWSAEQVS
jgi:peptidyl-dipeptidase Dcp